MDVLAKLDHDGLQRFKFNLKLYVLYYEGSEHLRNLRQLKQSMRLQRFGRRQSGQRRSNAAGSSRRGSTTSVEHRVSPTVETKQTASHHQKSIAFGEDQERLSALLLSGDNEQDSSPGRSEAKASPAARGSLTNRSLTPSNNFSPSGGTAIGVASDGDDDDDDITDDDDDDASSVDLELTASEDLKYRARTVNIDRIDRIVFVKVVHRVLKRLDPSLRRTSIRKQLAESVFDQIDSDGLGYVSWDGVTELLLEYVRETAASHRTDGALTAFDRYVHISRKPLLRDTRKLTRVQESPYVFCSTRTTHELCHLASFDTLHTIPFESNSVLHDAMYFSAEMVNETSAGCVLPSLATFNSDLQVHLYDVGPRAVAKRLKRMKSMRATATITKTAFANQRLFTGDREGVVTLYDAATLVCSHTTMEDAQMGRFNGGAVTHRAVTGLLPISSGTMLSSSLTGIVNTTDIQTLETTRSFKAHESGVVDIAYSPLHGFVITQGFSTTTTVWVGNQGANSFVLFDGVNPHLSNVIAVECVDDLHQILTADSSGLIKVWDIRRNACIFDCYATDAVSNVGNTLRSSEGPVKKRKISDVSVAPLQDLVYDQQRKRIVTAGHRCSSLLSFVSGESVQHAHEEPIRAMVPAVVPIETSRVKTALPSADAEHEEDHAGSKRVVKEEREETTDDEWKTIVISSSATNLKQWDGDRGGMLRALSADSHYGDITAVCTDDVHTKLFYATVKGYVVELRLASYRQLKVFAPLIEFLGEDATAIASAKSLSGYEVSSVFYSNAQKAVITLSVDGLLRYYSDVGEERIPCRIIDCQNPCDPSQVLSVGHGAVQLEATMEELMARSPKKKSRSSGRHSPVGSRSTSPGSGKGRGRRRGTLGDFKVLQSVDTYLTAHSPHCHLIAIADPSAVVRVVDEGTATGVSLQEFTLTADVVVMTFLGPYPILLVGTSNGHLNFFPVRGAFPPGYHNLKLATHAICTLDSVTVPLAVAFDSATGCLYLSDSHALVQCYSVGNLISTFGFTPQDPESAKWNALAVAPPTSDPTSTTTATTSLLLSRSAGESAVAARSSSVTDQQPLFVAFSAQETPPGNYTVKEREATSTTGAAAMAGALASSAVMTDPVLELFKHQENRRRSTNLLRMSLSCKDDGGGGASSPFQPPQLDASSATPNTKGGGGRAAAGSFSESRGSVMERSFLTGVVLDDASQWDPRAGGPSPPATGGLVGGSADDEENWVFLVRSVDLAIEKLQSQNKIGNRGDDTDLQLDVSQLQVLHNGVLLMADVAGGISLWAPGIKRRVTMLNPSSVHKLDQVALFDHPPGPQEAHYKLLDWTTKAMEERVAEATAAECMASRGSTEDYPFQPPPPPRPRCKSVIHELLATSVEQQPLSVPTTTEGGEAMAAAARPLPVWTTSTPAPKRFSEGAPVSEQETSPSPILTEQPPKAGVVFPPLSPSALLEQLEAPAPTPPAVSSEEQCTSTPRRFTAGDGTPSALNRRSSLGSVPSPRASAGRSSPRAALRVGFATLENEHKPSEAQARGSTSQMMIPTPPRSARAASSSFSTTAVAATVAQLFGSSDRHSFSASYISDAPSTPTQRFRAKPRSAVPYIASDIPKIPLSHGAVHSLLTPQEIAIAGTDIPSAKDAPQPKRMARSYLMNPQAPRGLVPALPHKTITQHSEEAKKKREEQLQKQAMYRQFSSAAAISDPGRSPVKRGKLSPALAGSSSPQPLEGPEASSGGGGVGTTGEMEPSSIADDDSDVEIEGFGMVVPRVVRERVERADRREAMGLPVRLSVPRRRYSWEEGGDDDGIV